MTKVVFGDFDVLYQDTGKRTLFILKERCDEVLLTKSTYPVVRSLIGGCAMLVHISHFERIGHFNPGLRYVQDYDMWFRMLHNRQSIYVNELMYTVRNHNLQGTQAQRESMKPEEIKLWEMYVEELSDDEMANIYGSKFLFLFEMWFRINAYQRPSKALCEKLRQEAEVGCVARALEKVFNLVCKGRNLPIAIFGAGVQGLRMYYLLRLTKFGVSYFIDNSLQKKGTEIINSIICKSANDIINEKESLLVIIAIDENADVIRQLDLAGFRYTVTHKQLEEGLKT
jgi:hypothetical protein